MAYQTVTPHSDTLNAGASFVGKVANSIGSAVRVVFQFMIDASVARTRYEMVQHLEALSDAQLAELGIKRENIVRHVFLAD